MKTRKSAFISFLVFSYYLTINKVFDGSIMQGLFFMLTINLGLLIAVKTDSIIIFILSFIVPSLLSFFAGKTIQKHCNFLYFAQL